MDITQILRLTALWVSVLGMIVGILVIGGWLVPTSLPEQFRVIVGAVVFLYGAYRFAVTYYRKRKG